MPFPSPWRALRPPGRRTSTRVAGAAAAVTALVVATALPASAHVSVSSTDAAPGGFGKVVFRVPTESATASTTRLTVELPTSTPFADVSSEPVPGWRVTTTERALSKPVTNDDGFRLTRVVGTVTWTATGTGLAPGQFQEFALSVGPFPDKAGPLSLPAIQTYSDGTVVRWDEPTPSSGKEPEHPAPTLTVAAAGTDAEATAPASSDHLARWLGAIGVLLGVAALGVAVASGRRRESVAP